MCLTTRWKIVGDGRTSAIAGEPCISCLDKPGQAMWIFPLVPSEFVQPEVSIRAGCGPVLSGLVSGCSERIFTICEGSPVIAEGPDIGR